MAAEAVPMAAEPVHAEAMPVEAVRMGHSICDTADQKFSLLEKWRHEFDLPDI